MASDEALRRRQVAHNAALLRQVQDAALRSQVPLSRPDQNVSRRAHFGIPGPTHGSLPLPREVNEPKGNLSKLVGCFSAEKVGCAFTELYYRVLYQHPEDLHEFYMDSSVAGWEGKDGVVHSVTTLKGINDMIMSSDYKDSSMELKSVYAQNSLEGHIILVVTGNLTGKDGLTRTFSHTFLLERHKRRFPYMNPSSSESEKNGIFILNDILRFPNTHPSTHESQNRSVLEASEAPSSTNSDVEAPKKTCTKAEANVATIESILNPSSEKIEIKSLPKPSVVNSKETTPKTTYPEKLSKESKCPDAPPVQIVRVSAGDGTDPQAPTGNDDLVKEMSLHSNSVGSNTSPVQITTFPSLPKSIVVNEDLTLSLVPRIKLNFTFGCIQGFKGEGVDELYVKLLISNAFHCRELCPTPLKVPYKDIHCRLLFPFKRTVNDKMWVLADGCLFFRDSRLVFEEFRMGLREHLLKYLSTYSTSGFDADVYQVKLSLPPEEDPDQMMASILNSSRVADNPEPCTLNIKALPQWFAEQPASLRIFLETMGVVRGFNADGNGITVEYEDCYKALKSLCGCSLELRRAVEGPSVVDYVLTWKTKRVLEGGNPTFFSPPLKKPCLMVEKLDTSRAL
ncbi:unnamed protein product [Cuscuta epithymum]|uniref:NTF2 domain-containing protein n=1 Tax=Cuscuta epithymum TaxID=186058 RepID=A0AAV0E0S4_9ASTE|nr:unnamed protein product [Cuscuta epithymum]